MQRANHRIQKVALIPSCCIGVGVAMLIVLLLTSIGALCITNEYFTLQSMRIVGAIIQFLAVFAGCVTAGKVVCDKQILSCSITASVVAFIFLGAAILLFDGVSTGALAGLISVLFGLSASVFVVIKKKKRSARRTIGRRSR